MQQLQNPPRAAVRGIKRDHRDDAPLPAQPSDAEHSPRWPWLLLGIAAAGLSHLLLPGNFRWFLAAIPHELGHATIGCLFGRPSAPAISLAGEAWTGIGEQQAWLVWSITITCATFAFHLRQRRLPAIALAITALALPAIAFTDLSQILIAGGGHLGELAFAAFCYSLCWNGGYTGTHQERIASAMAGALLQFGNLRLAFGLLTDFTTQLLRTHQGLVRSEERRVGKECCR